jgi:hypothetical protein
MHLTVYKSVPVTTRAQALELSEGELSMVAGGVGSTHIPAPDRTKEHRPVHPAYPNRPHRPTSPAHPVQHTIADLHAGHTSH